MKRRILGALIVVCALACSSCGSEESGPLMVSWAFAEGDCASHQVERILVTLTPEGGEAREAEFACEDGSGEMGEHDESGVTYEVTAEGVDADGQARVESLGQSVSFGPGAHPAPSIDITLQPKTANVVVTWSGQDGGSCPPGVILPYYVSLYEAPADGEEFGAKVTEVQESCATGEVTLNRVAPGDYVVEVDSRAVSPALRGTEPVTVAPGQDADVHVTVE